ncbi:glycosyltransferase involved in cell wall biosynthesis [Dysgonomonas alginatilytica]|uniref:Glycosyltransferase involved in cell wall biosynthesis n=1 Tax=Dysgonomonas alginatilytica TaxID=1605892 RepID=A0A2V3PNI9_9BACT|nr:glycosyltransferase family 4 protein [Dysgonomonas alginatilytica]PXV62182.1 glycosyltransferase involved in cell wall biosynthesis [Dysgonomonas alginatilytica]
MKKLFIIVNVDWFFLSHRQEIAVSAKEAGYDVTILAKDTGKSFVIKELGLRFIDLPMNSVGMNPFEELTTLNFLYKLYKREKPDIVHHVGLKAILWGGLAAKQAKVKGVVNAISGLGVFFAEESKSVLSKAIVAILKYSHNRNNLYTIFQNNEDKDLFLKSRIIKDSNIVFIKGSGVDLNVFKYIEEPQDGKIKVVLTARMIVDKGIFVLTEAAEQLRADYQDKVQFLLCGGLDKNPRGIKEEMLNQICDDKYIKWFGHCSDIKSILEEAHIVTLPSYYKEGLPKSLIEGTAIGRPIVTTNSIGCRDTVIDCYNGFLIPIKDSKALADKLKILFDDKYLRLEMGRNSRLYAEKYFSLDKVIKSHLDIYKKLAN